MSVWQWALEIILIILLGATLFYAMRLERSIGVLRRDRAGLGDVLASIRIALDDAERGIQSLRQMADVTGGGLSREIEAAKQAGQDLQFLLERLERAANRAESIIKSSRAGGGGGGPPPPPRAGLQQGRTRPAESLAVVQMKTGMSCA
jgi:hypothetical protein